MRSAELSELKQLTSAYSLKKKNKPFQPNLPQMCSCKWRSIYWHVFFSAQDWSAWFMKPGRLIWNADVERVKCTLLFFLCCMCQGEKWLAQGSVTHTHLITFLGPRELSQAVVDAGAVPSTLYSGVRNCSEKDCCFSPKWYFKAFSRVNTDSRRHRSYCFLSLDDPQL